MEVTGYETQIIEIKKWLGAGSINIFGLPFAGKDTHSRELASIFGGAVIGGGDILRAAATEEVRKLMHNGFLAPTGDYLEMVLPYLSRDEFKGKPLILSSVGRWHGEETSVMKAARESGHPIKIVIYLSITANEMRRRWEIAQKLQDRGKRHDDAEHVLETRLEEFQAKTRPVIEFYRSKKLLAEIDGLPPPDEVLKTILDQLYLKAAS